MKVFVVCCFFENNKVAFSMYLVF